MRASEHISMMSGGMMLDRQTRLKYLTKDMRVAISIAKGF